MSKRAILLSAVGVLAAVLIFYEWQRRSATAVDVPDPYASTGTTNAPTGAGASAPLDVGTKTSAALPPDPVHKPIPRDPPVHPYGVNAVGKSPYTGAPFIAPISRDPAISKPKGSFSRV